MSQELVESNIYRVTKMCSNCPFRDNGKAIHLEEGRVDQIKAYLLSDDQGSFSCHKTAHNLDTEMNGYKGEPQKPKMCAGAYEYLKKEGRPNLMMRLAVSMGIEND